MGKGRRYCHGKIYYGKERCGCGKGTAGKGAGAGSERAAESRIFQEKCVGLRQEGD